MSYTVKDLETLQGLRAKYGKLAVAPSFLRLEKSIGASNIVKFDTTQSAGSVLENEVRIKDSDAFCITKMGLFIYKTASAPVANDYSQAVLYTYPNPAVFTGSNESAYLQSIFNGYLSIKVGQTTFVEKYPTYDFLEIPETQKGLATAGYDAGSVTANKIPFDSKGKMSGFNEVITPFTLSGKENIDIQVTRPGSLSVAGTSSTNMLVLIFKGFLISGGSSQK